MKHLCSIEARGRRGCPRLPALLPAAVLLAGLLRSSAAGAQATPSAAPAQATSRSELLIQQGMELRSAGKDEEALSSFEEAAALEPESMRARVHLAATHQALGHWLEADAYLREVLQAPDDVYVRRHQATLEHAAEFVGRHVGSLLVTGQPAGAVVRVDGRAIGKLPLPDSVRMAVGAYQLEVSLDGFYPARRPLAIAAGSIARESVELAPLSAAAGPADPAAPRSGASAASLRGSPTWLSWTLSGVAAGAALTTGVALVVRDQHAERWNRSACLQPGRRRGEVCGAELDAGKAAERLAYASGIATALLAAGAVLSWSMSEPAGPDERGLTLGSCSLSAAGGVCSGWF